MSYSCNTKRFTHCLVLVQLMALALSVPTAKAQEFLAKNQSTRASRTPTSLTDMVKVQYNDLQKPFTVQSASHVQTADALSTTMPAPAMEAKKVVLSYGMHRKQALRLLGEPTFESIIGSLRRARAEYQDVLELFFERDQLVSILATELVRNSAGRLQTELGDKVVIFEDKLDFVPSQVVHNGDLRSSIVNHFFFAASQHAAAGMENHFTPAAPWWQQCRFGHYGFQYGYPIKPGTYRPRQAF